MDAFVAFWKDVGLSFIPLFVALDAIGVLPFLLALTRDMSPEERPRVVRWAMVTALGFGLGFLGIGKGVFVALGIEVADFLVAGGIILLALSIKELATGKMIETQVGTLERLVGVVPIGTPLVVGPATLTTLLVLLQQYAAWPVIGAFVLNLALAWLLFSQANRVARLLGQGGLLAASKIASLLLAAIAIRMVRLGLSGLLAT